MASPAFSVGVFATFWNALDFSLEICFRFAVGDRHPVVVVEGYIMETSPGFWRTWVVFA